MSEQAPSKDLLDALKYLVRHYVGLMEHARDRIRDLGGQCDPVDVMERGDPHLRIVREIIAKHEAASAHEPAQSSKEIVERMGAANAFASPATANLWLAQGIREIARLEQENAELRQDLSDARNGWESAVAERSALEPMQPPKVITLTAEQISSLPFTLSMGPPPPNKQAITSAIAALKAYAGDPDTRKHGFHHCFLSVAQTLEAAYPSDKPARDSSALVNVFRDRTVNPTALAELAPQLIEQVERLQRENDQLRLTIKGKTFVTESAHEPRAGRCPKCECEVCGDCLSAIVAGASQPPFDDPFQDRVHKWMQATFDADTVANKVERNHRFLEESLELVQSLGCMQADAHMLVDYVFGRPVGECEQETGGVMVTLAALANASNIRVNHASETELARCWTKIDVIRAKQAGKPKHSPLPGPTLTKPDEQPWCGDRPDLGTSQGEESGR